MTDDSSDAPPPPRPAPAPAGRRGWLPESAPWLALAVLAVWTRELSAWWLVVASGLLLVALLPARPRARVRTVGLLLLLAAVAAGFAAHLQLGRLSRDWPAYWQAREANVFEALEGQLEEVLDRGSRTVQDLILLVEGQQGQLSLSSLETLRRASGFPALALYGPEGVPTIWAGTHRGRIPDDVQLGLAPYVYGELPLFSYLYFTAPIRATGGTAVVAYLLRTELPEDLRAEVGDLVSRFKDRTGEEIRISTAARAPGQVVRDFVWGEETLFSVWVVRPAQADRMREVRASWIRLLVSLLLGAWLLLALFPGAERRAALSAAGVLALLLAILPWSILLDQAELFSAADFLLPSPGTVTLGRLLAITLGACVLAGLLRLDRPGRLPGVLAAAVVGLGFPLAIGLFGEGASVDFLARSERQWAIYQLALAGVLSLLALGAFVVDRRGPADRPVLRLAVGAGAALLLAAGAAWHVRARGELPEWAAAAWLLPALTLLPALHSWPAWRKPLLLWAGAVVLGTTAALPFAWSHRVESRKAVAEGQLGRLGVGVDTYLEDLLLPRLGTSVDSLHQQGASPMELLFRMASGLAEEGYPVWTTYWSPGGFPERDLAIGVGNLPAPPVAAGTVQRRADGGRVVVQHFTQPDAHYMVQVLLSDFSVVSGVVPPLRRSASLSPLGQLFGSFAEERPEPLVIVPLIEGDAPHAASSRGWLRTAGGWRAEVELEFPDERYHARYDVDLASPLILLARATLLLAIDLALLLALWGIGRLFGREARPPGVGWTRWITSFRARVTLALFGFFLLSNAIFGTLAYRNIAGAAERAAQVLAERVAQDAAELYLRVSNMDQLAGRVGGDLLEYRDGRLTRGADEELVELGLYEGLVPFDVFQELRGGRELVETRGSALGRWEYLTAFRRLADGGILAVPVPLQAGATAIRRREVADLLLFAIVAGAALSLVLALLVGRTLTRPIRTLQVASERVGSGNLGVRLDDQRSDEFGAVFSAFNRMVRRLRRARSALVRTTRRTRAIVEDAATGVIALDAQGRVTLVNPRAEALLGRAVPIGQPLSDGADPAAELVRWVQRYFRDGLREAGSEFQWGERRIRVRARRITRSEGSTGGAVLSLEDVTDELRSERILAWGEMARQVAHEVKNPLTPIKLSIQHIQRAHGDRRPDFDQILGRNAEAMLREIDRLAAIATSFSRFGAPSEAGADPLEAVRIDDVVKEVLTLYATGEGPIRFEGDVPPDLPPVNARESEMKEVLVNLLENARAAIAEQGTVRVEAREVEEGVVLTVRDDGAGMPPELLPRIFEPHFSTRSSGTGLGLAIVRRLVEGWDAAVSVESEPGRGTAVHISLRPWTGSAESAAGQVGP